MTTNIKEWNGADILTCYESLSGDPYALFLDSNSPSHPLNRWSFVCWNPAETITCKNGVIIHNDKETEQADFFSFLQSRLNTYPNHALENDIPFTGGAAGYFGYDLGRQLENIPNSTKDDLKIPDAIIGIYTNILAYDHITEKMWLIGDPPLQKPKKSYNSCQNFDWKTNKSETDYCTDIQKAIDYIYAGEIYQVNLSRRFETELPKDFDAFGHYKYLRDINPAPFSAFMNFNDIQLASCSPERFLSVKDKNVETRPIKGTLSSSENPELLTNSEKDRAENTMIVDLLRNDLSKVCDYHSVKVPELCSLETFEGLHHLVSTVTGILQKIKNQQMFYGRVFPVAPSLVPPKLRPWKSSKSSKKLAVVLIVAPWGILALIT